MKGAYDTTLSHSHLGRLRWQEFGIVRMVPTRVRKCLFSLAWAVGAWCKSEVHTVMPSHSTFSISSMLTFQVVFIE